MFRTILLYSDDPNKNYTKDVNLFTKLFSIYTSARNLSLFLTLLFGIILIALSLPVVFLNA